MTKKFSFSDHLIINIDTAFKTLFSKEERHTQRPTPAKGYKHQVLTAEESKHVAGLMRVNHTGEVCAQALYQGQALTATLAEIREKMNQAADEEIDHLGWCEIRLKELNTHTSYLNPAWYALSLTIGAIAGLAGDKWSLGFVAETEKQVTHHLEEHIKQLPASDLKSLKILQQMAIDETCHAAMALDAGGADLPPVIKFLMHSISKVMTKTSYYL